MRSPSCRIFNLHCLALILAGLIACQEKEECSKYAHEVYLKESTDTSLINGAIEYRDILLERFGESSIRGLGHEAYHLQFYSSHGHGNSIKFEQVEDKYTLKVKCHTRKNRNSDCKEYQIKIEKEEWDELTKMVYEFNFWTAENFRARKGVLDGYVFLLEGNRPEAKKCHKKTYKLVGRGSPEYDKMGALCENILHYEDQLRFSYEQQNKIH